jgi:SAM-dependent methyltransferase
MQTVVDGSVAMTARTLDHARKVPACLLCGRSTEITFLQRLRSIDLQRLWRKAYGSDRVLTADLESTGEIWFCKFESCDLRFFSPTIAGSVEFYTALHANALPYRSNKREFRLAARFLSQSDRVLEVGCGVGAFAELLGIESYTGLEINPDAVRAGRDRGLNILHQTIEEHALSAREQYDFVCSFQVMEHVASVSSFMRACVRCLKPGGLLVHCVPSEDSFLKHLSNDVLNLPPHHVTRWTDRVLTNAAGLFGLDLVQVVHEQLEDCHLRIYSRAVAISSLARILKRAPKLADMSVARKIIGVAASCVAVLVEMGMRDPHLRGRGHTVAAVYRKK